MSSSMSMEGAELVDGMAVEVDSVGSRLLLVDGSCISTRNSWMQQIFSFSLLSFPPPVGPSCLEVHCQLASLQCAFAFTLGVEGLVKWFESCTGMYKFSVL